MIQLQGKHYRTGQPITLSADRVIRSIEPAPANVRGWLAPALFDLQVNGCMGVNFSNEKLTVDEVRQVVGHCRKHGLGGLLPTLISNSFEAIRHGMETIRRAVEADPVVAASVPGIHLEGPYLSELDGSRGAHPARHIRPPSWHEFCRWQEAAGGRIRLVTLAPEKEGALRFIEKLVEHGVVVSLGHTAATPRTIREAIRAGARLSTHLGNGCQAMLPRHESYLWEQLASDDLWASLITDSHHLPPALVKIFQRVKGNDRLIITCDASSLAGLPPGRYREWETDIEILPIGKIVVPHLGVMAGSWAFTEDCVSNMAAFTGIPLADAIDLAGAQPRKLLGLPPVRLEPGMPADLLHYDVDERGMLIVRQLIVAGSPESGANATPLS
jgi:N-acetylglucosamine-6-phosphate deacetylase